MAKPQILCHTLRNGVCLPSISLGTWAIGTDEDKSTALQDALEIGYRALDDASCYGNEHRIGPFIKDYSGPLGVAKMPIIPTKNTRVLSMEDYIKNFDVPWGKPKDKRNIFVCTKIWVTEFDPEDLVRSLDTHLSRFGRNCADMVLLHWPGTIDWFKPSHSEERAKKLNNDAYRIQTWRALEKEYRAGKVRAIGVSNYCYKHLKPLIEDILQRQQQGDDCATLPMYNEVEASVFVPVTRELEELCQKFDIVIGAYSPLGGNFSKDVTSGKFNAQLLVDDAQLKSIAQKHNVTPSAVALRFLLEKGYTVLPKASKRNHLEDNFKCVCFKLDEIDMETLRNKPSGIRNCPDPEIIS